MSLHDTHDDTDDDASAAREAAAPAEDQPPRSHRVGEHRRLGLVVVGVLIVSAAVLAVVGRTDRSPPRRTGSSPLSAPHGQAEGTAVLGAMLRRGHTTKTWTPQDAIGPGDTLQFTYASNIDQTLAIFGVEGQTLAPIFPTTGTTRPIRRGREVKLEATLAIDDAGTLESIVGVFCRGATELGTIRAALERGRFATRLPDNCRASELHLGTHF